MRIGLNPNINQQITPTDYFHQVVIPVYIPNEEGYFKDSFQILKNCIESLLKTSHSKTYFTLVNNGSCKTVENYINQLHQDKKINEIVTTTNIGKLNAILKGIAGQNMPLITITDADVMFLNHWQKSTYEVFLAFPKAGAVSTTPSSRVLKQHTYNVILDNLFNKKMCFSKVVNKEAMKDFAISIQNPAFYNNYHLDNYLTISKANTKAVIGASHFVATYKNVLFNNDFKKYSRYVLGGESENEFLDKPVAKKGYWRLSTVENYTYHMGNTQEEWMTTKMNSLYEEREEFHIFTVGSSKISKIGNIIRLNLFNKILIKPFIWQKFLQYKGLSKEASKNYR
jgi:hypothetical protein